MDTKITSRNFIQDHWLVRVAVVVSWLFGLYTLGLFFACAPGPCAGELFIKSTSLKLVVGITAYVLGYFKWFRYITYIAIIIGCILFVVDPI